MKKYFSVIALSLLVLSACKQVAAPTGDSASSSSASSVAMSSSSADRAEADPLVFVRAWAPSIAWSASARGVTADPITIDADHQIPAGAMQANRMTATISGDQFTANTNNDARVALDDVAESNGWEPSNSLQLDGETGTMWGYKMDTPDGVRFLMISAVSTGDAMTYEMNVYVTDPLPADADL